MGGKADHVACDVSDDEQQKAAFDRHMERCGRLDIAVLNAGVGERGSFLHDEDGGDWRRVLAVDLLAAQWGVRLAARAMMPAGQGTILVTASAAAVYPIYAAPIYASGKGSLAFCCAAIIHLLTMCTVLSTVLTFCSEGRTVALHALHLRSAHV